MPKTVDTQNAVAVESERNSLDYHTFTWNDEEYFVKKRFKRLKFLRHLGSGELFDAIALVFDEDELARLEEQEIDEEQLEDLMEIIAKTLLGGSGKEKSA